MGLVYGHLHADGGWRVAHFASPAANACFHILLGVRALLTPLPHTAGR